MVRKRKKRKNRNVKLEVDKVDIYRDIYIYIRLIARGKEQQEMQTKE